MCGIAGLYTKTDALRSQLGFHLAAMLGQLSDRGPDSAGVAFYRDPAPDGCARSRCTRPPPTLAGTTWRTSSPSGFGDASLTGVRATHAVFMVAAAGRRRAGVAARHTTPSSR